MTKHVVAHWLGGSRFDSSDELGGTATMEGADGEPGYRPTALLLASLAGCTAMDVISILRKKRQAVERYEVRVTGDTGPSMRSPSSTTWAAPISTRPRSRGRSSCLRSATARSRRTFPPVIRGSATATACTGPVAPTRRPRWS